MNLLYVSHRIPYPPNKGDKIRSFHMLEHLAKRHRVWCAFFVDDPADAQYVKNVEQLCEGVVAIRLNRRLATLRGLLDLAIDETATEGFYREASMARALAEISHRIRFDAALVYSSSMGQYLRHISAKRRVIDLCDLDSRKWASMSRHARPPRKWLLVAEPRRLAALEKRLHAAFDATILIGQHEAEDWEIPERHKLHFVGNGVKMSPACQQPISRDNVVGFTGDMGYFPNEDAMQWFARDIWPLVRAACPEARFEIVGRNPSRGVRRLNNLSGIHVVGTVDDMAKHLAGFTVTVAPLRIARGIQNKVLEAMVVGRPVVCTTTAAQGLNIAAGKDLLVADDASTFAAQVVRLLRDKAHRDRLASNARSLVQTQYAWTKQLAGLEEILFNAPRQRFHEMPENPLARACAANG